MTVGDMPLKAFFDHALCLVSGLRAGFCSMIFFLLVIFALLISFSLI
ncbi:MAG: hypothetical protein GJU72_02010 [Acidithiobacillus ferriphilus]|nr:hypothetical protein [Acidithiobacillus ferriphilus]MBW9253879.1 hypothetical protein [Acidithiobacillus ferriphilus]